MANEREEISAVSVKLPGFWSERAAVWFVQAEAQFAVRGITSEDTKYHHVVAALDQDTATRILDLLQDPPPTDKYTAIKDRLLKTFTLSEPQRASALLNLHGPVDDKPSLLMDKMLTLLGAHTPCFLFREIFMRQLPVNIRTQLAQANISEMRELAKVADTIWIAQEGTVNSIQPNNPDVELATIHKAHSKSVPAKPSTGKDYCFFHRRFGQSAKQCRPPCSYPVSKNGNTGRQ